MQRTWIGVAPNCHKSRVVPHEFNTRTKQADRRRDGGGDTHRVELTWRTVPLVQREQLRQELWRHALVRAQSVQRCRTALLVVVANHKRVK